MLNMHLLLIELIALVDVIYDPFLHDRNLRMQIDCNKSRILKASTLTVDGYLPYGDELIPNFETLTSDSKYFRDTLVGSKFRNS